MNRDTLEKNILLNRVNLSDSDNVTRYQRYRFKAFQIVDSYTFHYKTTLVSILYLVVLSFEFGYRYSLIKTGYVISKERTILQLVFDILGATFVLLFLIELIIRLFALDNVKLYTVRLAALESTFLFINIVVSTIDMAFPLDTFLEIKILVVAVRLLLQVYRNKQVVEVIEKHEYEITREYEEYYKSMILKYESIKLKNKELETEMEEYSRTIAIREDEIKSLDTEMIETHRKSWSALVSPLLAVKVNIPTMRESSASNQRKSKELKASTRSKQRGHSISFFK